MLETYSVSSSGISVATDDSIQFNVNSIDTDCRISHTAGSSIIEIDKPGYYQVTFSSFGYNTGTATTDVPYSGTYTFQLYNNGVAIANAIGSEASTTDTDIVDIGFTTIIKVNPSCPMVDNNALLTVNYLGQAGTVSLANLTIVKLR